MPSNFSIEVDRLSYHYGDRKALSDLSLRIAEGEIFGLLGPNGGGKTTLFRILSSLAPFSSGRVSILGWDLPKDVQKIRESIGVIFQSPSLDKKLTVWENLRHQGHLYGLSGNSLRQRMEEMLDRVGLKDRVNERVERLSGGLQRRVEVAKSLLHRPRLLLLDEPTTGLDPGGRKDLWEYLQELRKREGTTLVFTTHLMEEAERCDRLGILDQGKLVALDRPTALRNQVGGEVVTIRSPHSEDLCGEIRREWGGNPRVLDGTVRLEQPEGTEWLGRLMRLFGERIDSVTIGKPTLEDVFIQLTGHRFWSRPAEKENGV